MSDGVASVIAERFPILIVLGLTASLANFVGGWIVSSRPDFRRNVLNSFISLGAGFMLAAAILEVIPESLHLSGMAGMSILAGYLFVHLVEHTIATHFHFGEETHRDEMLDARAAYSALAGLVLHAFFDGALIAAGFWLSMELGVLLFLAIFLHKIPEGFTAASIMRVSGRSNRKAFLAAAAISASTLAGVLSLALSRRLLPVALPFSAGVTLYVAASDLIPEVNKERGVAVSVGVFLGVVLFLATEALLDAVL
ncbi:MAG: ZIP family metal transporter [Acidobacteria bacterium]|nr:ZIP family metal transporter [Acidobacteriota bacterium]